jgi:cell division protein FtsB
VLPAVTDPRSRLAARAEQALLERLPVDTRTLQKAARYLEPKHFKLLLASAVALAALLSLIKAVGRDQIYRAAVSRELKRQLAPVNDALEELRSQNEELARQNEELKKQLDGCDK